MGLLIRAYYPTSNLNTRLVREGPSILNPTLSDATVGGFYAGIVTACGERYLSSDTLPFLVKL